MKKKEMLNHWNSLKQTEASQIKPQIVPYKHVGSTYDEDGIRLTGSCEFIDSVLAVLKPLLRYENGQTRLQVVYKQSTDRKTGELMNSHNCYIQVHERGGQAQAINTMIEGAYARAGKTVDYAEML